MTLQGSDYHNPQAVLNSAESTQANGLDLDRSSYMSTGVGGKRMKRNKSKKRGGGCGCSGGLNKLFQGGKSKKHVKNEKRKRRKTRRM